MSRTLAFLIIAAIMISIIWSCSKDNKVTNNNTIPVECADSVAPTYGTAPLEVHFDASASGGNGTYTYERYFHSGSGKFEIDDTIYTYLQKGIYYATLRVKSGNAECNDTTRIEVYGYSCSCSADKVSGDSPLLVHFTGSVTDPGAHTFIWDFGNNKDSSLEQNPSYTITVPGTYWVECTSINSALDTCRNYIKIEVGCNEDLSLDCEIDVLSDTSGPAPLTAVFEAPVSGGCPPYSYAWNFGDNNTGTGQHVTHRYDATGPMTVQLTVNDVNNKICQSSTLIRVDNFSCAISVPTKIRAGVPAVFTGIVSNGTAPYSYSWDYGNGSIGSGQTDTTVFNEPGLYHISMTATDAHSGICVSYQDIIVTCSPLRVTARADSSGFLRDTISSTIPARVSLISSPDGGCPPFAYDWDFGDGSQHSSGVNTTHEYCQQGIWKAILHITDTSGNSARDTVTIVTSTPPGNTIYLNQNINFDPGSFTYTDVDLSCPGTSNCSVTSPSDGQVVIDLHPGYQEKATTVVDNGIEFTITRSCGGDSTASATVKILYGYYIDLNNHSQYTGDTISASVKIIIEDITEQVPIVSANLGSSTISRYGSTQLYSYQQRYYTRADTLVRQVPLEHNHAYRAYLEVAGSANNAGMDDIYLTGQIDTQNKVAAKLYQIQFIFEH
ncbi:MAG: PKD domain-containing protein [candidate division Zixibacteria bacterium]|nr:PKD domain-containing protein [candidate division Zixibacteria bacterium]